LSETLGADSGSWTGTGKGLDDDMVNGSDEVGSTSNAGIPESIDVGSWSDVGVAVIIEDIVGVVHGTTDGSEVSTGASFWCGTGNGDNRSGVGSMSEDGFAEGVDDISKIDVGMSVDTVVCVGAMLELGSGADDGSLNVVMGARWGRAVGSSPASGIDTGA